MTDSGKKISWPVIIIHHVSVATLSSCGMKKEGLLMEDILLDFSDG